MNGHDLVRDLERSKLVGHNLIPSGPFQRWQRRRYLRQGRLDNLSGWPTARPHALRVVRFAIRLRRRLVRQLRRLRGHLPSTRPRST
ncbi:MAG TPA: hypothetical protein VE287_05215 [Actinopolymorphaceae bacterium]|nr:hypothetical protein [Actinopolymorphaceae bacterium]